MLVRMDGRKKTGTAACALVIFFVFFMVAQLGRVKTTSNKRDDGR